MTEIDDKYADLKAHGVDLGAPRGAEEAQPAGGRRRQYELGNIYFHPNAGAHALRGVLRDRYESLGGAGFNPATGRRDFGYPINDGGLGADARVEVTLFEWGGWYWIAGGTLLYGPLYTEWVRLGGELRLGYPISNVRQVGDTEISWSERALLIYAPSTRQEAFAWQLHPPLIGQPRFTPPELNLLLGAFAVAINDVSALGSAPLHNLIGDPFSLRRVQQKGAIEEIVKLTNFVVTDFGFTVGVEGGKLSERALYDLHLDVGGGRNQPISYHCVYARSDWSTFGFAHATDLHVSARADQFEARFRKLLAANKDTLEKALNGIFPAGMRTSHAKFISDVRKAVAQLGEAVTEYNNFNNRVREFIVWANEAHDAGALDLILAPGDLVDYQFEDGDNRNGAGNFGVLLNLMRGNAPPVDPADPPSEELRVPLLVTLGNHDYRPNHYELDFTADIQTYVLGEVTATHLTNYEPHNLIMEEAWALQGSAGPLSLSPDKGQKQLDRAPPPRWYSSWFCDQNSYAVELGPHRFVMLDSGPDAGVASSWWGTGVVGLFGGSEDEESIVGGHPRTAGFTDTQLGIVNAALDQSDGLVVVGVHAPILNIVQEGYHHYLREAEHASQTDLVLGFLWRYTRWPPKTVPSPEASHPTWPTDGPWFKTGNVDDMLDWGTVSKNADALIALAAGVGARRPADVVLFGHVHRNVEFRVERDTRGGFRYLLDWYTETPPGAAYYNSRHYGNMGLETTVVRIRIEDSADPHKQPTVGHDAIDLGWADYHELAVPPYRRVLTSYADVAGWWREHRPLLMQTASLGPIDKTQRRVGNPPTKPEPPFQGWRIFTVRNDVIASVHHVRRAHLSDDRIRRTPMPTPDVLTSLRAGGDVHE